MTRELMRFAMVLLAVCLIGCGSQLPSLDGTVTLDGDPLQDARLVFESPGHATAFAKTDAEGNFEAMTGTQPGLAAGSYAVAVSAFQAKSGGSESPIPVLRTPKKYNSSATSGLTVDVQPGRNSGVHFLLQTSEN